jgi:hypothetical protein
MEITTTACMDERRKKTQQEMIIIPKMYEKVFFHKPIERETQCHRFEPHAERQFSF